VNDRTKELLADLLLRWEELHDRGQDTPATELAKEHPELIPELERRIKLLKKIAWLDKPLDDDPPGQGGPTGRPPASPRTLAGRYRLDELIAEGGFAQVFRAFDQELQRTVAVKLPKPGRLHATDEFLAEARRAARLKHDGIIPVHDVGKDGDSCFIVTEYLEGGSLADRMANGRLSHEDAIRWITDIAAALEHAHLNGVIHRDVKPGNILIDQHGRAKLADFGIAQSASKTGSFAPSLGTLKYMAPEQLQGSSVDPRSDIYSLAVVLYEALTGRVPYPSAEPNALRREIVQGAKTAPDRSVSAAVKAVCDKALNKSPHQRHASAAQFSAELRRAAVCAPSMPWRALASIPLLVGVFLGGYFLIPLKPFAGLFSDPATRAQRLEEPNTGPEVQQDMNALGQLSAEKARELSQHKGGLALNGLTTLSDEAANALLNYNGWLSLNGLTSLSDTAAMALATGRGNLHFEGLKTMSDEAARALSQRWGNLYFNGLTSLSDGAAEALSQHKTNFLFLNGLTEISPTAAESLSRHEGPLKLDGLKSLPTEVAQALTHHKNQLYLNGVKTISPEAAEALGRHKGVVYLEGLTTLSDEAADLLRANAEIRLPDRFRQ